MYIRLCQTQRLFIYVNLSILSYQYLLSTLCIHLCQYLTAVSGFLRLPQPTQLTATI
jgi:hypothetical protein